MKFQLDARSRISFVGISAAFLKKIIPSKGKLCNLARIRVNRIA